MPDHPSYRSQVLDHLGLVAGMCDELGIGDVIDQATHQTPEPRDLTVGEVVKAMVMWLYSSGHTETRAIADLERCVR